MQFKLIIFILLTSWDEKGNDALIQTVPVLQISMNFCIAFTATLVCKINEDLCLSWKWEKKVNLFWKLESVKYQLIPENSFLSWDQTINSFGPQWVWPLKVLTMNLKL